MNFKNLQSGAKARGGEKDTLAIMNLFEQRATASSEDLAVRNVQRQELSVLICREFNKLSERKRKVLHLAAEKGLKDAHKHTSMNKGSFFSLVNKALFELINNLEQEINSPVYLRRGKKLSPNIEDFIVKTVIEYSGLFESLKPELQELLEHPLV